MCDMCCVCVCVQKSIDRRRGRSPQSISLSVEPDVPVQEPLRHLKEAYGLRVAEPAALQTLGKERFLEGISDDVDGEHHWREHDVYEDLAHHILRHALLFEEANLHHERKKERGERAELRRGHEHVDLVRVKRRAAEEVREEEAADEELGEDREEAPLLNEGCDCHEHRLARHLEELVVPEVGLELAADEAEARLVPSEDRALPERH